MDETRTTAPKSRLNLPIISPFAGLIVVIVFIIVASHQIGSDDTLPFVGYVFASIIWALGLFFGLRGLRNKTAITRKRFWLSILSISLNVLFLCLGITGLTLFTWLKVQSSRMESRNANAEIQKLNAKLPDAEAVQLELARRAASEFSWHLLELQKTYDSIGRAMTNPPILDVARIKTKQELQERADLIAEYRTASLQMLDFCKNASENFQEQLLKHQLTDQMRKTLREDFWNNIKDINPRIIALREADVRKSKLMAEIIGLLQKEFDQWQYLTNPEKIQFKTAKALDEYNRLNAELASLNAEIENSQAGLRKQLKSSNTNRSNQDP